jgi:fructokinase
MILVLGEILFDELPQGRRAGGAPFNFARHLHRLGHDVRFVSCIGRDKYGVELLKTVLGTGLDSNGLQRHDEALTGRVAVTLDSTGVPSYDIVVNAAYDFIDFDALPPMSPEMVYFGSLIQRTKAGRIRLQNYLQALPESALRFYDVNFRSGCTSADILIPSLQQTDILKLNDDELPMVGKLTGAGLSGEDLIEWLMQTFAIQQVALTRGAKGCALYRDGGKTELPPGPLTQEQIVDTVGAGDSFAAMLAHCILNRTDAETTLKQCSQLAEFVCTVPGAVPEDPSIYKTLTGGTS